MRCKPSPSNSGWAFLLRRNTRNKPVLHRFLGWLLLDYLALGAAVVLILFIAGLAILLVLGGFEWLGHNWWLPPK